MKIAIGGLKQETNCFSSVPTPESSWAVRRGDEIFALRGTASTEIGGILSVADRCGWEILPTLFAHTSPSQPTDKETYEKLREGILAPIRAHKDTLDGVILCFHGAMTVTGVSDPEGDISAEVRKLIGSKPYMITLDLHANNTKETVDAVDAVFGYDTNPHIDMYDRGRECALCMEKTLAGTWKPVTAHCHPPMVVPTINMRTAEGPVHKLLQQAFEWEKQPGVINVSVFGGFPYTDCDYTGLNIVTTTDGDPALAKQICTELGSKAWELRQEFIKQLADIPESIRLAGEKLKAEPTLPVILADVSDNAGGGGSSDTTMLMQALLEADFPDSAVGCIWDEETVNRAIEVGVGNTGRFRIGGNFHDYGEPVETEATVRAITDGTCRCYGLMGRGDKFNFGKGVRLQVGNVHICVYSTRRACNYREIFTNLGIDPARQKVLLIKSRGHFRADFEPISDCIIEVDAPGAVNPNILRYPYQHVYGWPITEVPADWQPE